MHKRLPQERKKYKERKYAEFFRQILDTKSGYRESNPLCPASQRYRCFLFLSDFSIPGFFRYANFCVFFSPDGPVCRQHRPALLSLASYAVFAKKGKLFAQPPLFFKPLLLLLYEKTMPLPALAAMLSVAAAFLPAIYLTCAH